MRPTILWTNVFYGVGYFSTFLRTICSTIPCLNKFLLLAWHTRVFPLRTLEGLSFKGRRLTQRLVELNESWEITKCTVKSYGWIDGKGRPILNFLFNCPKGSMFFKSIDASTYVKDAQLLCELFDVGSSEDNFALCWTSHYKQCF